MHQKYIIDRNNDTARKENGSPPNRPITRNNFKSLRLLSDGR